jgi:hypothetical protein
LKLKTPRRKRSSARKRKKNREKKLRMLSRELKKQTMARLRSHLNDHI